MALMWSVLLLASSVYAGSVTCLTPPCYVSDIKAAVDAAVRDEIITIEGGPFTNCSETVWATVGLTLRGIGRPIIDCGGVEGSRFFRAETSGVFNLEGLHIMGAALAPGSSLEFMGGAALVRTYAVLNVIDCVIEKCAANYGAAIAGLAATVNIVNSTVANNTAGTSVIYTTNRGAALTGSILADNVVTGSVGNTGVWKATATVSVSYSTISGHNFKVFYVDGQLRIDYSLVTNNQGTPSLAAAGGNTVNFLNSVADGNAGPVISSRSQGGLISLGHSTFTNNGGSSDDYGVVENYRGQLFADFCVFQGNRGRDTGVLFIEGTESSCGGFPTGNSRMLINDCVFEDNTGGSGGAAHAQDVESAYAVFTRCTFLRNGASGGGGQNAGLLLEGDGLVQQSYVEDTNIVSSITSCVYGCGGRAELTVRDCDIVQSASWANSAVRSYGAADIEIINTTIVDPTDPGVYRQDLASCSNYLGVDMTTSTFNELGVSYDVCSVTWDDKGSIVTSGDMGAACCDAGSARCALTGRCEVLYSAPDDYNRVEGCSPICDAIPGCQTEVTCLTGVDDSQCTNCGSDLWIDNSGTATVCAPCEPVEHCAVDIYCSSATNSRCNSCEEQRYRNNSGSATVCSPCLANCDTCTSATTCSECGLGFYFDSAMCSPCITNCGGCSDDTTCDTCLPGFFGDGSSCEPCVDNCFVCENSTTCGTCDGGFYGPDCASCADITNCDAVTCTTDSDEVCATCADGFYGDTCTACPANCALCSNATCSTCAAGYTWDGSACAIPASTSTTSPSTSATSTTSASSATTAATATTAASSSSGTTASGSATTSGTTTSTGGSSSSVGTGEVGAGSVLLPGVAIFVLCALMNVA